MLELILLAGIVAVTITFVGLFAWMVRQVLAATKLPERRRASRWRFFSAERFYDEWQRILYCLPKRFGGRWKDEEKAGILEVLGKPELVHLTLLTRKEPREIWSLHSRSPILLRGHRREVMKRAMGPEALAQAMALDSLVRERQAERLAPGGLFLTRTGRIRRPFVVVKDGSAKPRWLSWIHHPRKVRLYDDDDLDCRIRREEKACRRTYRPVRDPGRLKALLHGWGVLRPNETWRDSLPRHEIALLALSGVLYWPPPEKRHAVPPTVKARMRQFRSGIAVYVEELARFINDHVLKATMRGWRRFWWEAERWAVNVNLRVRAADPVRIHNQIRADNAAGMGRIFARVIYHTTWADMRPVRLGWE